jgi:hypothetical protein
MISKCELVMHISSSIQVEGESHTSAN